jgi:hypothetical protein
MNVRFQKRLWRNPVGNDTARRKVPPVRDEVVLIRTQATVYASRLESFYRVGANVRRASIAVSTIRTTAEIGPMIVQTSARPPAIAPATRSKVAIHGDVDPDA